jgi:hypothetical protein
LANTSLSTQSVGEFYFLSKFLTYPPLEMIL